MSIALPDILQPTKCDPNLRNLVSTGPRTKYGLQQRVFGDAGFWAVNCTFDLRTPDMVRAWRALIPQLRSGTVLRMPIFDRSVTQDAFAAVPGTLKADADLRDTQIVIAAPGIDLQAGLFIGIGNRLHVITAVVSVAYNTNLNPISGPGPWDDDATWHDNAPSGRTWTIKILPPMRGDVAAGAAVKFTGITLLSELEDMAQGDTDLNLIRRGPVSITLTESI